ncbi:unnamed protein product [marine sediment metagenome]|uniref:Uncharacterized protein n=1 Tax=marine sediment metagenome TaxID=412755 RepID=X0WEP0_9ZZZZ
MPIGSKAKKYILIFSPPDIRHRGFWGPPTDGLEYGWVSNSRLECDEVEVPN